MKKLVLNKETLWLLTPGELGQVRGGKSITETDPACDNTCLSALHHTLCVTTVSTDSISDC